MLPPCHHHCITDICLQNNLWWSFLKRLTENRLRNNGPLVVLSLSIFYFVFVCLVRRCSSLKVPQFGYIYPYMCLSYPISGTICYLECRHGFQSNGGVNVLQCGKNGNWNQNVSSALQCKGTSFFWLFRLFEAKQKMKQCCFSKISSCPPLSHELDRMYFGLSRLMWQY